MFEKTCGYCGDFKQVDGFQSPGQAKHIKQQLDSLMKEGYMLIIEKTWLSVTYECVLCHRKWALYMPDFPVRGGLYYKP